MSLQFDVRRSIILSEYVKCWGVPESRKILSRENENIELYVFSGEDMDQVTRFATIGLSASTFSDAKHCNSELLLVVPFDIGIDLVGVINDYMFDICHHIVTTLERDIKPEDLVLDCKLAPQNWPTALLFDEPRGEPEEVSRFHIGLQSVALSWVVPIFTQEYDLIKSSGIESFDAAVENMASSLVEIRREPCI